MIETDAVTRIEGPAGHLVLTCEHASARLPGPWSWQGTDALLLGTHWSYDIGAAELTALLAARMSVPATLSRFSRLLCDPNRPIGSPTMFVTEAEGRPVLLNRDLTPEEIARRIEGYYRPYHGAVDAMVASRPGAVVLSIHSFTPVWKGAARTLEIGVLFDRDEALGLRVAEALRGHGHAVEVNEPYSGKGFMYSAQSVAERHGRRAVELEIRQDLCGSPFWRERFAGVLQAVFSGGGPD